MEGSQALSSMDTKSPEVVETPFLFIAPWAKIAVTPSLGIFRVDWMHPANVRSRYAVHVSLCAQPKSPNLNGNFVCQRLRCDQTQHSEDDRTLLCLSPVISIELPEPLFCDRTRSLLLDWTQTNVRSVLCLRINSSSAYVSVR